MFGNNNQNQQLGDTSNVGLPGADSLPPQPQFSAPAPQGFTAPSHSSQPAQDLSVPEITDHASLPQAQAAPTVNSISLADLKQQALSQLTPLVGHLEQSPEEKFRTTMMMIQATDDQALLQQAYGAAQAITDEKSKAQALLDVVNEINYFSQKKS
jgi:hypothetical protein